MKLSSSANQSRDTLASRTSSKYRASCNMSSSSHSNSEYKIPNDHVALVLLEDRGSSFYLQVPLTTIRASCLKPLKYLLYLGWCILSAEGVLSFERDDRDGIDTDEDAVGGEIYYYVLAAPLGTFLLLSRVHAGHLQQSYLSVHRRSCPSCRPQCHQGQD